MQSLANALAVISFIGVVILLFGYSALLRIIRDLQSAVLHTQTGGTADAIAEFSSSSVGTLVLAVSAGCESCAGRIAYLADRVSDVPFATIVLSPASVDGQFPTRDGGGSLQAIVDAGLVGKVSPTATPTAIFYDAEGLEQVRRIISSDDELEDFIARATAFSLAKSVASGTVQVRSSGVS
jgi:hypothetical protein